MDEVTPLKYGSLFSGIGGIDAGFDEAGWQCAWQVEKEPFCVAVLKTHWPAVQRFPDVCGVGRANLSPVDCIVAGVPCQDVSVAGRRKGLKGQRTGLFFEFARILQELRPAWFVFENVPGLFSSNEGRDFAEVLRILMVECGYGVAWRVLDSRYFNVAQRRERVFIVGRFGEPCPAEILFESESGSRDSAQGGETWADLDNSLTQGSGSVGSRGCGSDDATNIVATLTDLGHHGWSLPRDGSASHLVAATLSSANHDLSHAAGRRREDDFNLVAFDAGQLTSRENRSNPQPRDPCFTLNRDARPSVAYSYDITENMRNRSQGPGNYVSGTLLAPTGGNRTTDIDGGAYVCQTAHTDRVRDFTGLPKGMDSPRYRALGNAVTKTVSAWIARRMTNYIFPQDHSTVPSHESNS